MAEAIHKQGAVRKARKRVVEGTVRELIFQVLASGYVDGVDADQGVVRDEGDDPVVVAVPHVDLVAEEDVLLHDEPGDHLAEVGEDRMLVTPLLQVREYAGGGRVAIREVPREVDLYYGVRVQPGVGGEARELFLRRLSLRDVSDRDDHAAHPLVVRPVAARDLGVPPRPVAVQETDLHRAVLFGAAREYLAEEEPRLLQVVRADEVEAVGAQEVFGLMTQDALHGGAQVRKPAVRGDDHDHVEHVRDQGAQALLAPALEGAPREGVRLQGERDLESQGLQPLLDVAGKLVFAGDQDHAVEPFIDEERDHGEGHGLRGEARIAAKRQVGRVAVHEAPVEEPDALVVREPPKAEPVARPLPGPVAGRRPHDHLLFRARCQPRPDVRHPLAD